MHFIPEAYRLRSTMLAARDTAEATRTRADAGEPADSSAPVATTEREHPARRGAGALRRLLMRRIEKLFPI